MPAATLAGALALAGCGGSDTTTTVNELTQAQKDALELAEDAKKCTDAGRVWDGKMCVDKPMDMSAADAAKAARAVYKVLGTVDRNIGDGLTEGVLDTMQAGTPAAKTAFGAAKDADKHAQSIMPDGPKFSATALTASTGGDHLSGFYEVADADAAAEAPAFGKISREKHDKDKAVEGVAVYDTTGTYKGVDGIFRCVATECTSHKGKPTGTAWHFKPDNKDALTTGTKIEWGWWLVRDSADDPIKAVGLYYPVPSSTLSGLDNLGEGSATYEGDATGQYAVTGDSGRFTAKATLTAEFGAAPKLSGSIHTFKGDDGRDRAGWSVDLEKTTGTGAGVFADGNTVWQGNKLDMAWDAHMYDGSGTEQPEHVFGAFRAESQGGRMAGAFGAEHEE